tara:strand:+ start:57352 stop:57894 length:543 start_codon:yes stop_codon:yes gene_type:complete
MSYCEFTKHLADDHPDKVYHDKVYGFPVDEDNELFGRLILEINQAGLSWSTILKKEKGFRKAYDNFDIEKVARYEDRDRERLLNDSGIIRNKLKVNAAIYNANKILEIQEEFGSFKNWLDKHKTLSLDEWVKLFKQRFKFTGGKILEEFLMSTSYLKGAHTENCPIFEIVSEKQPIWDQD